MKFIRDYIIRVVTEHNAKHTPPVPSDNPPGRVSPVSLLRFDNPKLPKHQIAGHPPSYFEGLNRDKSQTI